MDTLVSVIVTTWNREDLLRETVSSILAQTYQNIELIIVDNESPDGTESYVRGIDDSRVRYFRHANGGNISVNRNYGAGLARGRWIAFCDDDDLWEPEKLEIQVAFMEEHPEVGIVGTNAVLFTEQGPYGRFITHRDEGEVTVRDLLRGWPDFPMSSVLLCRSVVEVVGSFNEDPAVCCAEDYEYWIRAAKQTSLYFINRDLIRYRVHGAAASSRDLRKTVALQGVMFAGLHDSGVLTDEEHETVRRSLSRSRRIASVKEVFKRYSTVRRLNYAAKRWIHRLRGGSRAG